MSQLKTRDEIVKRRMEAALGTLKHEGMTLRQREKELLEANLRGEISDEEFFRRACEIAKKS
ncbi:hypothetical protein [Melghirimyces profundicolus]|uniref:hypothetical protein n=1 Tax=Melghirimyces profundicolus TaxID=1242148 RepID=UPI0011B1E9C5|nr:hypothetical protein [Melghirimyces profundicolus]